MDKFVSIGNVRIHYVVREGSRPAIVLLHGAGSNHTVWTKVLPYLGGRKLILPDFRGHGRSSRGEISMKQMLSDLKSILRNEQDAKIDVVGYSLGATIAAEFAKQNPKLVNKLVLMSIVSNNLTRLSNIVRWGNLALLKIAKLFNSNRKLKLQDYGNVTNPIYSVILDVKGTSLTAYFGSADVVLRNAIDISGIKHKTLVLQGKYDYSLYKSILIKNINKNTQLKFLSTHHLLVNKPEELGPALRNFLIF